MFRLTRALLMLPLTAALSLPLSGNPIEYDLTRIDGGLTWVSGYWGYNAPKLAYDGSSFYTVGLWGERFEDSIGTVYKISDSGVVRGLDLEGILQPPMVMLDSEGKLVIACAMKEGAPLVLHGNEAGGITDFRRIPLPDSIQSGRYMGSGIHGDTLVLGFLHGVESDFMFLVCDLETGTWAEPVVLQPGQVDSQPRTSWVYPIIVPQEDGVHLLVTNADTGHTYNQVRYLHVPYPISGEAVESELLAEVKHGEEKVLFGQSLWISEDGSVNAVLLYQPAHTVGLHAFHRDPESGAWSDTFLKKTALGMSAGDEGFVRTGIVKAGNATLGAVGSLFEDANGTLWLPATAGSGLDLFASRDGGKTWETKEAVPRQGVDFKYSYFLHGLHPRSGSVLPPEPHVVFSSTIQDGYELWMARFLTEKSE